MQEFEIEKIVRSKRKTIALEVSDRATLIEFKSRDTTY